MSKNTAKAMTLLAAYEELTERESFCLGEANMEGVLAVQSKKAAVLEELQRLAGEAKLAGESRRSFDERIGRLLEAEKANEARLAKLMDENRREWQQLSKQSRAVSRVRKAYGKAPAGGRGEGKLSGQA